MHRRDTYSEHSSIIWRVWLNGWVFVYELSGCGFESNKGLVKWSSSSDLKCNICGKKDHLPGDQTDSMLYLFYWFNALLYIQCSTAFRDDTSRPVPVIKKERLIFQCLYTGAKITDTKHSEGRCQRDYTCKHPSHDKFPTKKHVLVCAEHKDVEENKNIFELCKYKCILKQKHIQLTEFSREIKLSFHLNQLTTPQIQQQPSANTNSNSTVQNTAIFQLQMIKNKQEKIFHFLS